MPVYHGTANDFTEFDPFMRGNSTHGRAADLGFFFSDEYDLAEYWSNEAAGNPNMEGLIWMNMMALLQETRKMTIRAKNAPLYLLLNKAR